MKTQSEVMGLIRMTVDAKGNNVFGNARLAELYSQLGKFTFSDFELRLIEQDIAGNYAKLAASKVKK